MRTTVNETCKRQEDTYLCRGIEMAKREAQYISESFVAKFH